ncbi:MAG: N-6 DNA methylase, partial [Dokdonella sp.]
TLFTMNDGGRAAVVLDTGALTRGSGSKNEDKERNIRQWFVDHDYIDGVILLPDNLFYNTTAAGVIVILNKRKPANRKDKVILLNASHRATKGKPKNLLADADVKTLAGLYTAAQLAEGDLAIVDKADLVAADYNLSPARWVRRAFQVEERSVSELLAELIAIDESAVKINDAVYRLVKQVAQ